MSIAEIVLVSIFLGLVVFFLGACVGIVSVLEQDEEKQKERMRKPKTYELRREEERNSASESANNFVIGRDEEDVKKDATYDIIDIACALVNLSDVEIERLENEENLTEEESKKLIHLLRCKVKRLEEGRNTQKIICPGLYDNADEKYIEALEHYTEDLNNEIKRLNEEIIKTDNEITILKNRNKRLNKLLRDAKRYPNLHKRR